MNACRWDDGACHAAGPAVSRTSAAPHHTAFRPHSHCSINRSLALQGSRDGDGVFMTLDHILSGSATGAALQQLPDFGPPNHNDISHPTAHAEAQLAHVCDKRQAGDIPAYRLSARRLVPWLQRKACQQSTWHDVISDRWAWLRRRSRGAVCV